MKIYLERVYDTPKHQGYRVLTDRVWPRGITKAKAALDEWCKELSPSSELRKWFNHDPEKWDEFSKRYVKELKVVKAEGKELLTRVKSNPLILLTGTKDMEHTHIIVLKNYLLHL